MKRIIDTSNSDKKRMYGNVIIYSIKQVLSVLFPLLSFAYVSRCLGASGLGQVNYAASIVEYFVILSGLGISTYAIRYGSQIRDDEKAINRFISEILVINTLSTFLSMVLCAIIIVYATRLHEYRSLLICYFFLVPFTTIGVEWIYNIYEDFLYITIRSVVIQIISFILTLIFVKDEKDIVIYVCITVFSTCGANVFNVIHAKKYVSLDFSKLKLCKHIKPIMLLFGMTVATTIYTTMDTTMLGIFSTDYHVGLYSSAHKVSKMLILFIGTIKTVSLPILSRYSKNDDEIYISIANEILSLVLIITLPVAVGTLMYSGFIINIISGVNYLGATSVLQCLAIDILIAAINGTLIYQIVLIKKGEKATFYIVMAGAITNLIFNYILIRNYNSVGAAIATCLSETVVLLLALMVSRGYLTVNKLLKTLRNIAISCVPVGIIGYIANYVLELGMVLKFVSILLCVIVYFIMIFMLGDNIVRNIFKSLTNRK